MPETTCSLCKTEFDVDIKDESGNTGNVFYKTNATCTSAVAISLCPVCYEAIKRIVYDNELKITEHELAQMRKEINETISGDLNGNDLSNE